MAVSFPYCNSKNFMTLAPFRVVAGNARRYDNDAWEGRISTAYRKSVAPGDAGFHAGNKDLIGFQATPHPLNRPYSE